MIKGCGPIYMVDKHILPGVWGPKEKTFGCGGRMGLLQTVLLQNQFVWTNPHIYNLVLVTSCEVHTWNDHFFPPSKIHFGDPNWS